ncbi:pleckstrin homology domain-containing family F member 1 [Thalassophryne amazonica]|uniref:pleckstrin homology domain-containing family F member 1 n=1 Tax=Thalassophryne amazonica TaxID=390379 RepID=UPI001471237A|nr:pleckstrin homology domain-containing family F member 1 [Thalassophryne amazonica]
MVDQVMFARENLQRIHAVEHSFGPSGKSLSKPGRVLIGEGLLMKQSRREPQQKVFFLFNDVLVYGTIILNGRWHTNQQVIPLEDIQLEDLEDSVTMRNQWLIRTPRKSFFVAAASYEEKRAWMDHIMDCRSRLLQNGGYKPGSTFAVTWIPDKDSATCMRCSDRFTTTQRRHHCRYCGFVVCGSCSKKRAVIKHIHPKKRLRVCRMCHSSLVRKEVEAKERSLLRGDSTRKMGSYEDDMDMSEEEPEVAMEDHNSSRLTESKNVSWSPYVYLNSDHVMPQ